METHEHQLARVEDYLHHRAPYLMVDEIVDLQASKITTTKVMREDEMFFPGHFPGAPIVPGAMLQEVTTQTAGILIAAKFNPMRDFNTHDPHANEYALGVLVRVNHARFRDFARPGDTVTAHVELVDRVGTLFEFTGRIERAGKRLLQNRFQLTNLPATALQGG